MDMTNVKGIVEILLRLRRIRMTDGQYARCTVILRSASDEESGEGMANSCFLWQHRALKGAA
jgi:hypothetical protein